MNGIEINSTEILSKVPSSFSLILAETQLKEVLFACNHSHHFFHKLGQQKELATYSMIYFFRQNTLKQKFHFLIQYLLQKKMRLK